jgi:hypothetical protein
VTAEEITVTHPQINLNHPIVFHKIYEPENFNPEYLWTALLIFVRNVKRERYPHLIERIFHREDSFSLSLALPNYERLDQKARDLFELRLPEIIRVRALTINDLAIETYYSQRKLSNWTFKLSMVLSIVMTSVLLSCLLGAFMTIAQINGPITNLAQILLLMIAFAIASTVGSIAGIIAWAGIIRKYLPARLFTHMAVDRKMLPKHILKFFETKGG